MKLNELIAILDYYKQYGEYELFFSEGGITEAICMKMGGVKVSIYEGQNMTLLTANPRTPSTPEEK